MLLRLPPPIQRQLKISIIRRRRLAPLPRNLPRVLFNDRAVALPMEFSRVGVGAWLTRSGDLVVVGVGAFLPGAREPPPHEYEACDNEAAENADGDCPDWCHCCGLFGVGLAFVGLWSERRGAEFGAELKTGRRNGD